MLLPEILVHPTFLRLTAKQQKFVELICSNGNDKVKAAQDSHTCKNEATARATADRLLRKDSIRKLVNSFFNIQPEDEQFSKDEFLAFVTKKMRLSTTSDGTVARLADLYAEV